MATDIVPPAAQGPVNIAGELARLGAIVSAAQLIAEELEDGADSTSFDRVTALQCVLESADKVLMALQYAAKPEVAA